MILVKAETQKKEKKKTEREIKKEFMYKCKKQMDYHFEEGCKCLKEAEEASIFLPNISDEDKAQFCFTNIIATLAPGNPTAKMVNIGLALCAQYGMMVMSEWQRVDTKLHQAKAHFEMEEFYRLNGKFMQDMLNAETTEKK